MCGIAGVLHYDGRGAEKTALEAMARAIHHRGPDANGIHLDGPMGIAHTRLAIVDLSGGAQPMSSGEGRYWITFNGEIFNYVELREELQKKGHRFATHSDTEVILKLYEDRGPKCVEAMNGQWAFAIWDAKERSLFLSRDRLGVRPLFFTKQGGAFRFASEVKAIFTSDEVHRGIDPKGLAQVLTFWVTLAPRTVFENIDELPPGHSMFVNARGEVKIEKHWSIDYSISDASEADQAAALRAALEDAARLRFTRADVPVGAYLSGGLDSTVITGIVRKISEASLKTFSVTFQSAEFDESEPQKRVVDHFGVAHHAVLCRGEDIGRVFPQVVWHAEMPMIRTAPAPLFLLSKLVRENGYKVVVTGEGADELLGGYDIFKEAKIRRFWARHPESRMRPMLLRKLYPYMPGLQAQSDAYLRAFFHVRPEDIAHPLFSHLPRFDLTAKSHLFFSPAIKSALAGYDAYEDMVSELPERFPKWHPFCQAQYLETKYLLPGYLLSTQGDRMAMGNAIEGRYPFLDPRVVNVASRIPPSMKMRALNEKYILKVAGSDVIPDFLLKRPKQPYRAPVAESFFDSSAGKARFEFVDCMLSPAKIEAGGLFHAGAVQKLAEKAKKGQIVGIKDGMALVGILSAQLVVEQLINRTPVAAE